MFFTQNKEQSMRDLGGGRRANQNVTIRLHFNLTLCFLEKLVAKIKALTTVRSVMTLKTTLNMLQIIISL